jgi:hypothetical protein
MHSFGNDAVNDSVAEAVRSLPRRRSGLLDQRLTALAIIGVLLMMRVLVGSPYKPMQLLKINDLLVWEQ